MKIFITGATGFLGKLLSKALLEKGHTVVGVGSKECDLTKEESLNGFNNEKFDQIFHLAAWVQAGDFNLFHQGDIWVQNQKMNTNILSWWKEKQPQAKFISIGTSCSYSPELILKEENYLLGIPHKSVYSYGMTKRMMYVGLQSMHDQYGMDYLCFVPSTLYGPGYHNKTKQLHFIFDLVRKIVGAKQGKGPAILWGDGYQKRELIFVDDFIETMLKLVESQKNELVNIGSGKEHTIREYAESICRSLDYDSNLIQYDTTKFVGPRSKYLNNEKLMEMIPDLGFTSLQEGINKTLQWYQEEMVVKVN